MLFGSLDVIHLDGMFTFAFNGPNGPRDLGASNDLKAFVEGRLASGMVSPELAVCLREFKQTGVSHSWKFEEMCVR